MTMLTKSLIFVTAVTFVSALAACQDNAHPSAPSKAVSIGNLGGLKVDIPETFAKITEYEGDPTFGERRVGKPPVRTYDSIIGSVFFQVRFPDMAELSTEELRNEKRTAWKATSNWLSGLVSSGKDYDSSKALERLTSYRLVDDVSSYGAQYVEKSSPFHGLAHYVLDGVDPVSGVAFAEQEDAKEVYTSKTDDGRIRALIICGGRIKQFARCSHLFEPRPFQHTLIELDYRIGLLPEWNQLQDSVTRKLLSLSTNQ